MTEEENHIGHTCFWEHYIDNLGHCIIYDHVAKISSENTGAGDLRRAITLETFLESNRFFNPVEVTENHFSWIPIL